MGAKIRMDQIFSKLLKLWQNRRWADGIRVEYFPRIQYVAAQWRSQKFTVQIGRNTRKDHRKNPIYVDVQQHFLWNKRQRKRMSGKCQTRISVREKIWKRTLVIYWSWFWEKVVLYQWRQSTRSLGQKLQKGCCWNSLRADVQLSVLRLHCPEVIKKSKGRGKLSIHYTADQETIETIFRVVVSANQLSLYGAVAEICEEYESLHERTGRPVVMGQSSSSLVLSAIKTEVLLDSNDPAYKIFLLQQYGERIEKLWQQDKLSKFCMDAGFLSVVENGQYFMTKDTGDLTQFNAVACNKCTLPRE